MHSPTQETRLVPGDHETLSRFLSLLLRPLAKMLHFQLDSSFPSEDPQPAPSRTSNASRKRVSILEVPRLLAGGRWFVEQTSDAGPGKHVPNNDSSRPPFSDSSRACVESETEQTSGRQI